MLMHQEFLIPALTFGSTVVFSWSWTINRCILLFLILFFFNFHEIYWKDQDQKCLIFTDLILAMQGTKITNALLLCNDYNYSLSVTKGSLCCLSRWEKWKRIKITFPSLRHDACCQISIHDTAKSMHQLKTIGLGLFTVQYYSGQVASVTISPVHFWFGDACSLEGTRSSSCVNTGIRSRACLWFFQTGSV